MPYPSSDQQSPSIHPAFLFFGGMLCGFLPLILLLSAYIGVDSLQHLSFNLCGGDPGIGAMKRAQAALTLYTIEWPVGLIAAIAIFWKRKLGWVIGGLFTALALSLLVVGVGLFSALIYCPWHLTW